MWFEILPCYAILVGCMTVPQYFPAIMGYILNGNMYRRALNTHELKQQYLRDYRVMGNCYKLGNLDDIPDEDAKNEDPSEMDPNNIQEDGAESKSC